MPTRWLDENERAAWVRLAAVMELLPGALDTQLRRDSNLTHFEYFVLAMLSDAPRRRMRMTELAALTKASISRLSHVLTRLEARNYVERQPDPSDGRAIQAFLTSAGMRKVRESAPGHVGAVRDIVIDALSPRQISQLTDIADAILAQLGVTADTLPPLLNTNTSKR